MVSFWGNFLKFGLLFISSSGHNVGDALSVCFCSSLILPNFSPSKTFPSTRSQCNQQILAYCKFNIRKFIDEIGSCSVIELFLRFDRNYGQTRPLFYFNFVLYQTMVKPRPLFRFYFGLCQTILQKNANFSRIRT